MNRGWLTGGTDAVISADLLDHVGEPHRCLTGRVTHTRQVLTAGGGTYIIMYKMQTLLCISVFYVDDVV